MTVRFTAAIERTLEHEGLLSEDPRDPGEITKYGISLRWLKSIGTILGDIDKDGDMDGNDVKALTRNRAIDLYWQKFWRLEYDQMPPGVGEKMFDTAVNMGPQAAHRLLQEALNAVGQSVVIDGILGPKTLDAVGVSDPSKLLQEFRAAQSYRYARLAIANVALQIYLRGWLRRAAA